MAWFIDFILHIDKHLVGIVSEYQAWTYLILFLIVFCETGLVVTPFLPGDSLLFAAGWIASTGKLEIWTMAGILAAAAILGDTVNFHVGKFLGPKVLQKENARFLKKEYLTRTHAFFEKYGGLTIIYARFVPIIRTFAPFLAGVGAMTYAKFILYNVVGGVAWVGLFVGAGYCFGNIEIVQKNFTLVILVIIVLSLVPVVLEALRHRRKRVPQSE